jgi:predicted ATPase
MEQKNLFVVTGGPGAGKTTLLEELRRLGYTCLPEVAREIIQEQVQSGGRALPWDDKEQFAWRMLVRSTEQWRDHTSSAEAFFVDRGLPDTLCYAKLVGLSGEIQTEALGRCQSLRYRDLVFIAPPWQQIYLTDKERKQNFEEAIATFQIMRQTYLDCGYELVELPRVSVEERAAFVLDRIGPLLF